MADDPCTRRSWLQSLGTIATAATGGLAGCIGGAGRSNDSQAGAETRSGGSAVGSPVEEGTPSPTASIETPTSLGPRPFVPFSPQPSEFRPGVSYRLASVTPTVAAANREAFGDTYEYFTGRWVQTIGGVPFEEHRLTVWINFTIAVVADFEQSMFEEWYEPYPIEKVDTYRGYDVYAGTVSGVSRQVVGVGEETVFIENTNDIEKGRNRIEHLIDLQRGVITPHYEDSQLFSETVAPLRQGVFTAVYPKLADTDHWLQRRGVAATGETLLFDAERTPATGRTVLTFDESVSSPRERTERFIANRDQLVRFPLTDPEITEPADRTVVVTDSVDPADVF